MGFWKQRKANVFITRGVDPEVRRLSNNTSCYYSRDDGKIRKHHSEPAILSHEIFVCQILRDSGIIPEFYTKKDTITYDVSDMVSLRTYLDTRPKDLSIVIYELYSYVHAFKKSSFVHGNLNIDNVFVKRGSRIEFAVINLERSSTFDYKANKDLDDLKASLRDYSSDKGMLMLLG